MIKKQSITKNFYLSASLTWWLLVQTVTERPAEEREDILWQISEEDRTELLEREIMLIIMNILRYL